MRFDGRTETRGLVVRVRSASSPALLAAAVGIGGLVSCSSGEPDADDARADTPEPSCIDDREWMPVADDITDYVDFVQLETGQFVRADHDDGVLDEPDLGPVVGVVCVELSEVAFAGPSDIEVGDAAYLAPGTRLRQIVGADPARRIGTVVDGRVLVYELWERPDATVGGQLIDLGGNIDEVAIREVDGGQAVVASIVESEAIEAVVEAVRSAPVVRSPRTGTAAGRPGYLLEFRRSDGTASRRPYQPTSGVLASDIVVPETTRLLLVDLIAEADPSFAAPPSTTVTSTTAPAPAAERETVDGDEPGLIPVPVNEAESTLRFDFGDIVGTAVEGDVTWIQFDRYQLSDGSNGPDLTEEVRFEGATDLPWANENPRFRWYPLAPDVEVLELEADWFNRLCDGEPIGVEFVPSSLNRLLALDARLVSLTVVDREVVRVRDQRSC